MIKQVLLLVKDSFTENYWINLDQKGSFTRQRFFYRKYQINLDQTGSFTCQRFFYRKLLNKSWSKRFFYSSKILLQKVIEKILIKQVLWLVKDSFTENYRINLDQKGSFTRQRFFYRKLSNKSWSNRFFTRQRFFYRKLSNKSWSNRFFYSSKIL